MPTAPQHIRAIQDQRVLELQWADGAVHRLPYKLLRGECPCAACVNEFTGERILDVSTIPETIHPKAMSFVGNYALKIDWSDGHNTGMYTWDNLARLGRSQCEDAPSAES